MRPTSKIGFWRLCCLLLARFSSAKYTNIHHVDVAFNQSVAWSLVGMWTHWSSCWVYACTKVNPNEFLSLILHFMLLFHSFYYSDSFLWVLIFPYIFLYFIFLYLRIYSRRGTLHLLPLRGYVRALTFWSEPTTRRVFASTRRDSFASTIPTCLHPLEAGLSNIFPCVAGGVETRAAYDLIGKSWPRARYMWGEPRNTVSLSSVLDHHWGGELWSTSSIVFILIIL